MIVFLNVIENEIVRNKLEEIYLEHSKIMFITAYSILHDYHEAEDVFQDAILRIANNLHKISGIKCKKTRSYLVIIVRNLSFNVYNKKKNITFLEHEEINRLPNKEELLIEEHMIRLDLSNEMISFLKVLYQPYSDILTLRYYYELDISEIAELLDITENNVSVRLSRAKLALKNIIEKGCENNGGY